MTASKEIIYSKSDLHVHTTASDGAVTPEQSLGLAKEAGLGVIAICDHDTLDGAIEAQRIAEETGAGVEVIIGQEITTAQGHLVALNIKIKIPSMLTLLEAVRLIHEQGGLAIIPHGGLGPPIASVSEQAMEKVIGQGEYFDGLEILNPNFSPEDTNRARRRWYNVRGAGLGVSDDHEGNLGRRAITLSPGKTKEDLIKAILLGKTIPLQSKLEPLSIPLRLHVKRHFKSLTAGLGEKLIRLPVLVRSLLVLQQEKD